MVRIVGFGLLLSPKPRQTLTRKGGMRSLVIDALLGTIERASESFRALLS